MSSVNPGDREWTPPTWASAAYDRESSLSQSSLGGSFSTRPDWSRPTPEPPILDARPAAAETARSPEALPDQKPAAIAAEPGGFPLYGQQPTSNGATSPVVPTRTPTRYTPVQSRSVTPAQARPRNTSQPGTVVVVVAAIALLTSLSSLSSSTHTAAWVWSVIAVVLGIGMLTSVRRRPDPRRVSPPLLIGLGIAVLAIAINAVSLGMRS